MQDYGRKEDAYAFVTEMEMARPQHHKSQSTRDTSNYANLMSGMVYLPTSSLTEKISFLITMLVKANFFSRE